MELYLLQECGYKDKPLEHSLKLYSVRNMVVVDSALKFMSSLTTDNWLAYGHKFSFTELASSLFKCFLEMCLATFLTSISAILFLYSLPFVFPFTLYSFTMIVV